MSNTKADILNVRDCLFPCFHTEAKDVCLAKEKKTVIRKHRCEVCGKTFKKDQHLTAHKQDKSHHDPLLSIVPQTCNTGLNLPNLSSKGMSTVNQDEKDNRGDYITL